MSMDDENTRRIANMSTTIREAVRKALPTPSGQFLTVMVPGKVVNFEDYVTDGNELMLPLKTQLNQAILCDDMPAMAPIQMGPTGRSVSRSYATTISKLVPAGTTVGVDDGAEMTAEQKRYKQAMETLSREVPGKNGVSLVELYTQKQATYTKAVAEKTKAFQAALKQAQDDPSNRTTAQAREDYDRWVQENAKTYRNFVQAAYMDWVITGKKEEVEYWFSVVDQDSALARVEQSKETMRHAVIQDSDGSGEYQTVRLEPSDWADKCKAKMGLGKQQTRTAEWYSFEINRLRRTNQMLMALKDGPPVFQTPSDSIDSDLDQAEKSLQKAIADHLAAEQAFRATKPVTKDTKEADKQAREKALVDRNTAKEGLAKEQKTYDELLHSKAVKSHKDGHNKLFSALTSNENSLVSSEYARNDSLIKEYEGKRDDLLYGSDSGKAAIQELAVGLDIPKSLPDPEAKPAITAGPGSNAPSKQTKQTKSLDDFFTPITVEVSATSESQGSQTKSSSCSFGASVSYGWTNASVSASHSDSQSKAMHDLANASIKISFECMRVDITRSWLRAELFYDPDLKPGPDVKISPGFEALQRMMEDPSKADELSKNWSMFSMYPVSFIVACNVVLEISGNTSNIQSHMNSASTSVAASLEVGPFVSVSGGYSESSTDTGATCKTTASGCRIEMKAPQIIAWVSQMVPALPRLG
ncbi:unnamed protein product [Rhizoctonia solani]|uniref:Uncharacterized protein n=1 Tax=Rhizoctonia solani TaxID=456999 RepID=A0A8H3DYF9_9AGAM|nr:unnamed protein product [Rhizoctonia solani]